MAFTLPAPAGRSGAAGAEPGPAPGAGVAAAAGPARGRRDFAHSLGQVGICESICAEFGWPVARGNVGFGYPGNPFSSENIVVEWPLWNFTGKDLPTGCCSKSCPLKWQWFLFGVPSDTNKKGACFLLRLGTLFGVVLKENQKDATHFAAFPIRDQLMLAKDLLSSLFAA